MVCVEFVAGGVHPQGSEWVGSAEAGPDLPREVCRLSGGCSFIGVRVHIETLVKISLTLLQPYKNLIKTLVTP